MLVFCEKKIPLCSNNHLIFMSGIITENFGDLSLIDIIYTRPTEESVVLVLVTSGYVDGSAETQNNLLDKMEGYLRHIQSDEFKQEYASNKVFIEVNFSEEPDVLITDLLAKCESWCEENGATLIVRINNELVSFVK